MRIFLGLCCLLFAGLAGAAGVEHKRGDFTFTVAAEPGFVRRHDVPAHWEADAPGANDPSWRYWLYDVQIDRRVGRDSTYIEHVFEPRSAASIADAGRFQIEFNPAYEKLTIHRVELRRDGRWQDRLSPDRISLARREAEFEQGIADGVVTALIVLDDIRVQDVIRLSYTLSGSNPILAGQSSDFSQLAWRSPVLDNYFRAVYDPGTKIASFAENTSVTPSLSEGTDGVEASMHTHAMNAVIFEDSYPIWYRPYPMVQLAERRTWAEVVAWAIPLYPKVDGSLPKDLESDIAQWSKLGDSYAKLQAALRAVQDQVRYFGAEMGENSHRPNAPADTWTRRYGDCKDKAYLLSTILARMGIQAVPALVSTSRGRAVANYVPAADVFNHVIVRIALDGKLLWVDPTISQQGGDPRDSDLSRYGVALPVLAEAKAPEKIVAARSAEQGIDVGERFVVDGERNVELRVETVYRGRSADSARYSIAGERREELSRRYADYYRKRYGELTVTELPVFEDDRSGNVLKVRERYLLVAPFGNETPSVRLLDVFGEALQNASALPASMSRKGPLDFAVPGRYRHEIGVDLSPSWKIANDHEEVKHSSQAFDYKRDIEAAPGSVKLAYDLTVKQSEVMPDGVVSHLSELRKVRDSLSLNLRLPLAVKIDPGEREKRLRALLQNVMKDGSQE